jgi:hypothetical protein
MGSYYDESMIHAAYFWMLMNINMGVFLECGYGFNMGMGDSTLHQKGDLTWEWVVPPYIKKVI